MCGQAYCNSLNASFLFNINVKFPIFLSRNCFYLDLVKKEDATGAGMYTHFPSFTT